MKLAIPAPSVNDANILKVEKGAARRPSPGPRSCFGHADFKVRKTEFLASGFPQILARQRAGKFSLEPQASRPTFLSPDAEPGPAGH
ncbi:hypothetical protein [Sphingobium yanoikuyae]|uniref:hypothetical protein n=1 Tax=Sphingobium yanoikuyae TaxID=13690 RepID=UPI0022DE641E|nr:hypothetical protein [Sphingobium yanoikuyae]WBQ19187.1 hypothetical protein PAE53_22550 [Sphingobium yanoikuyae]